VKLTQTIRSACKPSIIYGNEGEEVNIIADHGEVMIVENKEGNKFPVNKQFLNDGTIIKVSAKPQNTAAHCDIDKLEEEPVRQLRRQEGNKVSRRNKRTVPPTLFN
jgi:formylmethanofuran dehydrogenase subunit D